MFQERKICWVHLDIANCERIGQITQILRENGLFVKLVYASNVSDILSADQRKRMAQSIRILTGSSLNPLIVDANIYVYPFVIPQIVRPVAQYLSEEQFEAPEMAVASCYKQLRIRSFLENARMLGVFASKKIDQLMLIQSNFR